MTQLPAEPVLAPAAGVRSADSAWSRAALAIAVVALAADCFLTSPSRFNPTPWPPSSLLKPIVESLGFHARFPTVSGVEVRNLAFALGSAALTFLAGLHLLLGRTRSADPLRNAFDIDTLARSPAGWWLLLLTASIISSAFSHAPRIAWGGFIIRMLWLAWWWPLAFLLNRRDAARLARALLILLAAVAGLGLWYQSVRAPDPSARLSYPFGNEGWMAACLLPAVVAGFTLAIFEADAQARRPWLARLIPLAAALVTAYALHRTGTRSALLGLAAAAFVACLLLLNRLGRAAAILVLVCAISAGGWWIREAGLQRLFGDRAASIRSRVENEWPIAIKLMLQKPVLGHGEGGYVMLAGQYARDLQFNEPAITTIDRGAGVWPAHAHNEYLELGADLGLVGMIAFAGAILVTLFAAARFLDARPPDPQRGLAVALAAALAAMSVEIAFGVALRQPGFPPIFLSVWAALWAVIRPRPAAPTALPADQAAAPEPPAFHPAGFILVATSLLLTALAVQDWRASLARGRVEGELASQQFTAAAADADLAARWRLEPFHHLLATIDAIRARSDAFAAALRSDKSPPAPQDLDTATDALRYVDRIKHDAPRFLWAAKLEADVAAALAVAHERLRHPNEVRHYRQLAAAARAQQCRDEPFNWAAAAAYLRYAPGTQTIDVLQLLRGQLRDAPADDDWDALFKPLFQRRDLDSALTDLQSHAERDLDQPRDRWNDPLSPETRRLAARAQFLHGDLPGARALVDQSIKLYEPVSSRLTSAHAAALLERAEIAFAQDPANPALPLADLDRAIALRRSLGLLSDVRDPFGRFQAELILANDGEPQLRQWLRANVPSAADADINRQVAAASSRLAQFLLAHAPTADPARALDAARRAAQLLPDDPAVWFNLALAAIQTHHRDEADAAIASLRKACHDPTQAAFLVEQLRGAARRSDPATHRPTTSQPTQSGTESQPSD